MNKRIRSMIDEIFSQMKMTAENLALRDELLANAQARYEDAMASGRTEEEAFAEVAASLEDVSELLAGMNGEGGQAAQEEPAPEAAPDAAQEDAQKEATAEEKKADAPAGDRELDLGETLNKAFSALESFGKSIMPQAKKLVRDVDDATGGALKSVGKAVNKGMRDAQKAAGDVIDKMSDRSGELVFDFGGHDAGKKPQGKTPDELRREAEDLRAQAGFKDVTGDAENAAQLRAQADALETQADALEQAQAMEAAARAAAEEAEQAADAIVLEEKHEPLLDEDGDVNVDAFTKVVDQIERETGAADDGAEEPAEDAAYTVTGEATASGSRQFPAAGLRTVDIELDADDVRIEESRSGMVEVIWTADNVEGEPESRMEDHKLKIRRKNPDAFKTFFSVFSKNGGTVTVRVPRGYAADYKISTTSGDICFDEVDVDSVKANTTSGGIRLEPDASVRADLVKATSVSGAITISACANDVKSESVSGTQFISCDAGTVDVDAVSGRVHVEGACEAWKIDSVSGSIELLCTVAPTRKIDIDTVSATARVALPGEIRGFAADISSMSGKIVNEFGPNRYGTCALPIHMDSMSGSLMITRL